MAILYVNGCSHTAAAEAVNPYAFAEDDSQYNFLGRLPHPDNLSVSWGQSLANRLKSGFKCDAESAASNDRIIRTTKEWIELNPTSLSKTLMVIQWSTWERQEWLIDGVYYQVNASGADVVPRDHQTRYKEYIAGIDWEDTTKQAHEKIWLFHQELKAKNIKHIFFNGNNHFESIPTEERYDFGIDYIGPYDPKLTYNQWLLDNNYQTVSPDSWHFGRDAHAAWANFVLKYIIKNQLY